MKLAICTPSRGQVSLGYRDLYTSLALMCAEREIEFIRPPFDDTTDGEKHQSRNLILYKVATKLEEGDFAYWLDSDVSHDPQLLFELLSRPEEIIARSYPIKPYENQKPMWSGHPIMRRNRVVWSEDNRLLEAMSFGFGAVLMKASAAHKLMARYGVIGKGGRGNKSIPAFDLRVNDLNTLCGEDVSFCDRWREEMGERLWIAADGLIRNGHHSGVYVESLGAKA